MRKTRDIAMRMIPVLLVVILLGALSMWIYIEMIDSESEDSWELLSMATHDVEKEMRIRFTDNLNILDLAADALIIKADLNREDTVLSYLATLQQKTIFERIDLMLPSGVILLQSGDYSSDEGRVSFAELRDSGAHLSLRRTDPYTNKEVFYYFAPVITDGKTEAILIGVIDCATLGDIFTTEHYDGMAQIFLIDRRDGSYLIDKWHPTLGNIYELGGRKLLKEYENVNFIQEIVEGKQSRVAFESRTNGKISFMTYTPVEDFPFSVSLFVQEDLIFESVRSLQKILLYAGLAELILLLAYLAWNAYIIFVSVGNQEKAQRAELEKAKAAAKSRFLSSISHDIRTPLNGIIGMLDVIRLRGDVPAHMVDSLRKIDVSAKYLLTLASDVLDMNELETDKLVFVQESFSLHTLAEDISVIMQPRAQEHSVSYHMDDSRLSHPCVLGSQVHLSKILVNLIGNAIKYNKQGGEVWFTLEELPAQDDEHLYRFTIRDTGIGMTEKFQKTMFNAFEQEHAGARTERTGHGLGLSIVHRLIEKMNGTITVDSKKDVGTTFVVTIPLRIDTACASREDRAALADLRNTHILLVEDNALNMEIALAMLENAGATVTTAINGQLAVDAFAQSAPYAFDAILMDIMMPVMDGHQATRAIRAMKRDDAALIPIIAMTAGTFSEDILRCKESGMNEHIGKPLDMNSMIAKVAKQIERFRAS